MSAKGKTRWYPRNIKPVRVGMYQCAVKFSSSVPMMNWPLEWDGTGFLVPIPMCVYWWRGMTKKAHDAAKKGTQ